MRILVSPHDVSTVDWSVIRTLCLFRPVKGVCLAHVHLTPDCSDDPVANVTFNMDSGDVAASELNSNYTVAGGSYSLQVTELP